MALGAGTGPDTVAPLTARGFGISMLTEKQHYVAKIFASALSMETKFLNTQTEYGTNNCIYIKHSLANIECSKETQLTVGDHLVIYCNVNHGMIFNETPLGYFRRNYTTISPQKSDTLSTTQNEGIIYEA